MCGLNVLNAVTARLVHYPDNGEAINDLADSIITADSQIWQVGLNENQKFSTAPRSSRAAHRRLDWAAYGPHRQVNAPFFAGITGYEDVHPADPDGDGLQPAPAPKAPVMSA